MKLVIALLLATAAWAADVTYVGKDKVAGALAKGGPLVNANDLTVSGSHRDKNGSPEIHDHETDVFYITEGEATFITGGTVVGKKATKAGQHTGTSMEGGQTHHLSKGDVMVIPAGVPHWFKEVPKSVSYYVVKVIK